MIDDGERDGEPHRIWVRGRAVWLTSRGRAAPAAGVQPPAVRMPVFASCNGREIRTDETINNASEWPAISARVARWLANRTDDPFASRDLDLDT